MEKYEFKLFKRVKRDDAGKRESRKEKEERRRAWDALTREEKRAIRSKKIRSAYRRKRDEFARKHPAPRYDGSQGSQDKR